MYDHKQIVKYTVVIHLTAVLIDLFILSDFSSQVLGFVCPIRSDGIGKIDRRLWLDEGGHELLCLLTCW